MKGIYKLRFKLLMACMSINQSIFCLLQKRQNDLLKSFEKKSKLNNGQTSMKLTSSISKRQHLRTYRTFRHLSIYNKHIPPPCVLTLTTSIIDCLSYRSRSNITACIHIKLIQCRSTLRSMIQI